MLGARAQTPLGGVFRVRPLAAKVRHGLRARRSSNGRLHLLSTHIPYECALHRQAI